MRGARFSELEGNGESPLERRSAFEAGPDRDSSTELRMQISGKIAFF
jgi:hypothetical protein